MRTFEKSHPWLSFKFDLSKARPEMWLALGEAASKCEHLSRVPLRPSTAELLHRLYLAKGAAATTAIEGNTLSEAEVLLAVERKLTVPPSKEYLKKEVENIINACNGIVNHVSKKYSPLISPELISEYNRLVLFELSVEEDVDPGKIRTYPVMVGNVYRGAPAEDCEYLLDRLCHWLNGPEFKAPAGFEMVYSIIQAMIAHLYLAWIHPFGDGNGRTARLIEFHILLHAGIPSPAAHLLSNHYNQTRSEYYRQLALASRSGGDILPFLLYSITGFVDGLREQMEFIWAQQWDIVWRNFVHERFQNKNRPPDTRQKHLALDLAKQPEPIPISDISNISLRLAKAYSGKTSKTIHRDINALAKMELIVREGKKIRARREVIFSFLPLQAKQSPEKMELK